MLLGSVGTVFAAPNTWKDTTGEGYGDTPIHPYSSNGIKYGPFDSLISDEGFPAPVTEIPGEQNVLMSCIFGISETVSYNGKIYFVRPTEGARMPFEKGMNCNGVYGAFDNVWELDPVLGMVDGWDILRSSLPSTASVFVTKSNLLINEAHAVGGVPHISGFGFSIPASFSGGGQVALVENEIYYFGGRQFTGAPFRYSEKVGGKTKIVDEDYLNYKAYKYNISTDVWTDLGDLFANVSEGLIAPYMQAYIEDNRVDILRTKQEELFNCLSGSNPLECPVYRSSITSGSATYVPENGKIYLIGGYLGVKNSVETSIWQENWRIKPNFEAELDDEDKIPPPLQRFIPNRIIWEYNPVNNNYRAVSYIDVGESSYTDTEILGGIDPYAYARTQGKELVNSYRAQHKAFSYNGVIYITGGVTYEQEYLQQCAAASGLVSVFSVGPCSRTEADNYNTLFGFTSTYNTNTNVLDWRAIPGDPMLFSGRRDLGLATIPLNSQHIDYANNRSAASIYKFGSEAKIYSSIDANNLFLTQRETDCSGVPFCLVDPPKIETGDILGGTLFSLDLNNTVAGWQKESDVDERNLVLGPAISAIVKSGDETNYIIMGREMCKDGSCRTLVSPIEKASDGIRGYPPSDFWMKFFTIEETPPPSCRIDPLNPALLVGEDVSIQVFVDPDGDGPLIENPTPLIGSGKLDWSIGDDSIAEFKGFKRRVRGESAGTTSMTAELKPSSGYDFASCSSLVIVEEPADVFIQGIKVIDYGNPEIEFDTEVIVESGEVALFRVLAKQSDGTYKIIQTDDLGFNNGESGWNHFNSLFGASRLLGDADGDGVLTGFDSASGGIIPGSDAQLISEGAANRGSLTAFEKAIFDVDLDGTVTSRDGLTVLQVSAGIKNYDAYLVTLGRLPTNTAALQIDAAFDEEPATPAFLSVEFELPDFDGIIVDFNDDSVRPGGEHADRLVADWVNAFNDFWTDPVPGQEDIAGWITDGTITDVFIDGLDKIPDSLRNLVEDYHQFNSDFYFSSKNNVAGNFEPFIIIAPPLAGPKTDPFIATFTAFKPIDGPPDNFTFLGAPVSLVVPAIEPGVLARIRVPIMNNIAIGPNVGGIRLELEEKPGAYTIISGIELKCVSPGGCDADFNESIVVKEHPILISAPSSAAGGYDSVPLAIIYDPDTNNPGDEIEISQDADLSWTSTDTAKATVSNNGIAISQSTNELGRVTIDVEYLSPQSGTTLTTTTDVVVGWLDIDPNSRTITTGGVTNYAATYHDGGESFAATDGSAVTTAANWGENGGVAVSIGSGGYLGNVVGGGTVYAWMGGTNGGRAYGDAGITVETFGGPCTPGDPGCGGSCVDVSFDNDENPVIKFLTPNIISIRREVNITTTKDIILSYIPDTNDVYNNVVATGLDNRDMKSLPKKFGPTNAENIWIHLEISPDTAISPPGEYLGTLRAEHESDANCFGELEIPFSIVDLGDIIEF